MPQLGRLEPLKDPIIILLGANGFLGRNLQHYWKKAQVIVTPILRDETFEQWTARAVEYDAQGHHVSIVNCIAISELAACEKDPAGAMAINAELPKRIGIFSREHGMPFIQISSDGLFPNTTMEQAPHYWSQENTAPITVYGQSKLQAENHLREIRWGHALRLSFIGEGFGTERGLITFLAKSVLHPQAVVNGFTNVWFNPIHTADVAAELLHLLSSEDNGFTVHQWGSFPAITKFDFLDQVAKKAGVTHQMHPVVYQNGPGVKLVPLDQSMKCSKSWDLDHLITLSAASLASELKLRR